MRRKGWKGMLCVRIFHQSKATCPSWSGILKSSVFWSSLLNLALSCIFMLTGEGSSTSEYPHRITQLRLDFINQVWSWFHWEVFMDNHPHEQVLWGQTQCPFSEKNIFGWFVSSGVSATLPSSISECFAYFTCTVSWGCQGDVSREHRDEQSCKSRKDCAAAAVLSQEALARVPQSFLDGITWTCLIRIALVQWMRPRAKMPSQFSAICFSPLDMFISVISK